jgi:hypothetical protein
MCVVRELYFFFSIQWQLPTNQNALASTRTGSVVT